MDNDLFPFSISSTFGFLLCLTSFLLFHSFKKKKKKKKKAKKIEIKKVFFYLCFFFVTTRFSDLHQFLLYHATSVDILMTRPLVSIRTVRAMTSRQQPGSSCSDAENTTSLDVVFSLQPFSDQAGNFSVRILFWFIV